LQDGGMTTPTSSDYVTRTDFVRAMDHIDARFERMDAKFDLLEARIESRIERSTVTSIRWIVGLAFGQYALMFGLILFVVARELAHG
jgi:hypothetical protein